LSILCLMELTFQVAMRIGENGCGALRFQLDLTRGTQPRDMGVVRKVTPFLRR
jgi:hypothetical protein